MLSKQFAPPPIPRCRPAGPPAPAQAAPPRPARIAPPPVAARGAASLQRFASFANRTAGDTAKPAPPGDELVALGSGNFGARDSARGLITRPDGTYNFVRTQGTRRMDQRLLISAKAGHVQLSDGKPVVYAGTVRFNGGALDWWSNYSGHYQPIAAFRAQAQLPEDKFVPWQRLQMGGTAMQRGMFRDRRPGGTPEASAPDEKSAAENGAAGLRPGKPSGASSAAAAKEDAAE